MPNIATAPMTSNIFRKPLVKSDTVSVAEQKKLKSKNKIATVVNLGLAALFLIVYSVFFLYGQVVSFIEAPGKLGDLEQKIEKYETVTLPSLVQTKDLKKVAYDEELGEVESTIDQIFPPDIDKLGIVRMLENFATAIHAKTPPFALDSISFGAPIEGDGYTVLPISTSIQSSRANFDRFVELVNLSGRLNADVPVRLMAISNVSIRYRGVDSRTGEDKGVDFSVKLNAYSR